MGSPRKDLFWISLVFILIRFCQRKRWGEKSVQIKYKSNNNYDSVANTRIGERFERSNMYAGSKKRSPIQGLKNTQIQITKLNDKQIKSAPRHHDISVFVFALGSLRPNESKSKQPAKGNPPAVRGTCRRSQDLGAEFVS